MHKWWIADAIRLCDNNEGGDWTGNHHRLCLCTIPELAMDMHTRNKLASYAARWQHTSPSLMYVSYYVLFFTSSTVIVVEAR
jgi:hypothetical protein